MPPGDFSGFKTGVRSYFSFPLTLYESFIQEARFLVKQNLRSVKATNGPLRMNVLPDEPPSPRRIIYFCAGEREKNKTLM